MIHEGAERENAPDEDGMTGRVAGDPDFEGRSIEVRLSPEDVDRVKAFAAQGHDIEAVRLVDPELYGRIAAAVLAAVAPADGWGLADDVEVRDLSAAPEDGGGQ